MRTAHTILLWSAALVAQLGTGALADEQEQRLKCRTQPGPAGLLATAYESGAVINIECQATGSRVGNTTLWHRTSDNCYVTDEYMSVEGFGIGDEPLCAAIDSGRPCRTIAETGVELIKQYEGFISRPRGDITGLPTIGYGHQCTSLDCNETGFEFPFTRAQAHVLLLRDIDAATQCLSRAINETVVLNSNQWSALSSWALSVGCDMAAGSQLVVRLNRGESPTEVVTHELPRWRIFHGKRVPELVSRRADELSLFSTSSQRQAHPRCTAAA